MAPKAKVVKGAPVKKENAVERRRRLAANRKAKDDAQRFVLPALLILFLALIIFFFYKYGWGSSLAKRLSKLAEEAGKQRK